MRFTDQNNAIHMLEESFRGRVGIMRESTEFEAAYHFIGRELPVLRPRFRKSIRYIYRPFFEAYWKATEKLLGILLKEPIEESGTLIYPSWGGGRLTFFYDLRTMLRDGVMMVNGRIAVFACGPGVGEPQLIFYTRVTDNHTVTFQSMESVREGYTADAQVNDSLALLLFIQNCTVESKMVAKGEEGCSSPGGIS